MSISFTNLTEDKRFLSISINVQRNSGIWYPLVLPQGSSVNFLDRGRRIINMKFNVTQELLDEIPLAIKCKYITGCIDYTLDSSSNKSEVIPPENPGDPLLIKREYRIKLLKRDACPEEGETHIDVNIKHPPGEGG